MGVRQPPDPSTAADPAAFVAHLAELRAWAGNPSLRTLRILGGTTVANNGDTVDALPVSTISYVLRGARLPQLPRRSFVDAYVAACFRAADRDPGDAVARWLDAWRALRGSGARPASTLPRDIGDFTGREEQLARITRHLDDSGRVAGVVAVSGMAGVGKTTLAVRAAHRLAPGHGDVRFVDLHGHSTDRRPRTPFEALTSLLKTDGPPPSDLDEAVARWRTVTAAAKTLVVIDNCLDSAQLEPLLPSGPGCAAVVTSRTRLTGLDGACHIALDAFTPDQAARLLREIAGDERLDAEPEALGELLDRLGGLPLAVRLAGAKLQHRPHWTVPALLGQLARLDGLNDGHRSVPAAFDLSYRQLPASTRLVFRLLSLHPGELGLPAAAALTGTCPDETWEELETLTDAHMIEQPAPGRYAMHDLLADYAAERRDREEDPDVRAAAVDGLLAWYLHAAHDSARVLGLALPPAPAGAPPAERHVPGDREAVLAWFETERANLIAAVGLAAREGRRETAWRLAASLAPFFQVCGCKIDWVGCVETALPGTRESGDEYGEAWLLDSLGTALRGLGRVREAVTARSRALEIRARIGAVAELPHNRATTDST
ncbi:NB-ARC domain-containing protein [Phytomonospora sp. NPDC050363]|uniref:ATP-binding protein n=1 Tax=Phytomonospora sp. NPDC050363 TaxID=3155642 RepID=UPI0034097723